MLRSLTGLFQAGLRSDLSVLAQKNLSRHLRIRPAREVDFASNDCLGLSCHPAVLRAVQKAVAEWGAGSGASRLLSGNLAIHEKLERALAVFKKEEAALIFSSGYQANLGAITSLVDERDVVLVDRLNHASLIDAVRLSGAKLWVYPHLELDRLQELLKRASSYRRRLVVTDAYFSMDGHIAPLEQMLELCESRDAILMVDEAHSTGVYGKTGRGLTEHLGLSGQIPVVMGTLSKALGSAGGYVAGSKALIQTLVNRAKSFIYTTAPVPAASAAALASVQILKKQGAAVGNGHARSLRGQLWDRVSQMRDGLSSLGLDLMGSEGPIIPIRVGDSTKTLRIQKALERRGFYTAAIRPPTVPKGTDRIRLSVSAKHSKAEVESFLKELARIWKREK